MESFPKEPQLIKGGIAVDERGQVSFINDFNFKGVKRFYVAENFSTDVIRAFHGHQKEAKYALVISGTALLLAVEMDDASSPNKNNKVERFILSARNPSVLYIPPGYANGFKALEDGTRVMFLSTSTLEESENDAFRFPYDYWGEDIWDVKSF